MEKWPDSSGLIKAWAPWNSPDTIEDFPDPPPQEPQELIDRCMRCPKPDCFNCLGGGRDKAPEGQLYLFDFFEL